MYIQELIEKYANVSINVEAKDLKHFADYLIEQTKKELEETVISDKAETYPTPKQVSEMFNVDLTTLWRWKKKGYLVPIEVGGKRRYKMSDVKAILYGGKYHAKTPSHP
ncbi:MAG: transcriptional regulator [Prolixibacteraceae bacterium]|nr:transcriptional regulator [Prolixibacteraceae bacterium]